MSRRVSPGKWAITGLVVLWVAIWMVPLWNVAASSTKTNEQYLQGKPWTVPVSINAFTHFVDNAKSGLKGTGAGDGLGPAFLNSLLYGVVGAILAIGFASLAAYSLARLPVRGRFLWFMLIFSGTLFPVQMYLVPLFKLYQDTNLYDTRLGMLCFYTAICIPFCVFVLRNWFLSIPTEIVEAASLDGCGRLRVFLRIFVPLSWAPFVTLFLFQFTWVWNDLVFGLTLARSQGSRPIMTLLAGLQNMYSDVGIPAVLASAIVASLPTLLLVLIFQRYFFRGLAMQAGSD